MNNTLNINDVENDLDSFLNEFEQTGAALSSLYLDEGKYKGEIVNFRLVHGVSKIKKGPNIGKNMLWNMWSVVVELDSQTAMEKLKKDSNILVYTDRETEGFGSTSLNLIPLGISSKGNIGFWSFAGKLLSKAGLAKFEQADSGEKTYKIDKGVLLQIYKGTPELKEELEKKPDEDNSHMKIPALLAELQLKNLSEFLALERETKKVYVHIQVRNHYQDKNRKEHFVRNILLPEEFEANPDNVALS